MAFDGFEFVVQVQGQFDLVVALAQGLFQEGLDLAKKRPLPLGLVFEIVAGDSGTLVGAIAGKQIAVVVDEADVPGCQAPNAAGDHVDDGLYVSPCKGDSRLERDGDRGLGFPIGVGTEEGSLSRDDVDATMPHALDNADRPGQFALQRPADAVLGHRR